MLNTIKERWKAELPDFFKKLRNLAIALGVSATSVWVTNTTMDLKLPEKVMDICKYTIAIAAAAGMTSQLTKKDNQQT